MTMVTVSPAVTLFDGYSPSSTTWNNSYRLRLLVEQTGYDSATNQSNVRFRLILYANGTQWFDGWAITGNVDYYLFAADGTLVVNTGVTPNSTKFEVWNSPSGNQTQGSAGADKTWADVTKTIKHDKYGQLRMFVHGDFKTNTAPSTTYPYLVPAMSIGTGTVYAPNTNTIDKQISISNPTSIGITRSSLDLANNTQILTFSTSGSSASPSGNDGTATVNYQYEYSIDKLSWTGVSDSISFINATQGIYLRCMPYINNVTTTYTSTGSSSSVTTQENHTAYFYYNGGTGVDTSPITPLYGYPNKLSSVQLAKTGVTITASWTKPSIISSLADIDSYLVSYASSTDGGSTWSSWSSPEESTTSLSFAKELTPGTTYKFRVKSKSSTSNLASYQTDSDPLLLTAFGKRFTSGTASTYITSAARYTGSAGDSVVVNGVTYTGWKAISNVKKRSADNTSWIFLES